MAPSRSRRVLPVSGEYRCAGINGCGYADSFSKVEAHVLGEHQGGCIEAVLGEELRGRTSTDPTDGTKPATPETAGSVLQAPQPSEGTDPASSDRELPSDDARSMYDPPAPRPRKRSRARQSIARSIPPAPKPHTPTPDERERVAAQIADAREIAEAAERTRP